MDEDFGRLTRCDDCGGELSTRAPFCPHCGAPSGRALPVQQYIPLNWGYEWKSQTDIFGIPLVHIAVGRKDGKLLVAKGVIAIGQFGIGLITIAQFGVGFLFGFGQFIFGAAVIAQFAAGIGFGLGQFATGYIAIGQMVVGFYGLGQLGLAQHIWTARHQDSEAVAFFRSLLEILRRYLNF